MFRFAITICSLLLTLLTLLTVSCAKPPQGTANDTPPSGEKPADECQFNFAAAGNCANLAWEQKPSETEMGRFTLIFREDVPTDQQVRVKLDMPIHGHGSRPVTVTRLDVNKKSFRATNVFFTMSGPWVIEVTLEKNGTVIDKASLDYEHKN